MEAALTTNLLRHLSPLRLAGPIFDKELRVASRRRRGYALRCVYVLFLMVFIAAIWIPTVKVRSGVTSRAQMETAAKTITLCIVWFQFFAAQLVAIAMLSTAISDEVYSRTLAALLTTPLSDRQVVLNKFSSRLVQVLLLVATSLPLLAVLIDGVLNARWDGGASVAFAMVPFGQALAMVMTTLDGCVTDVWWFGNRLNASEIAVLMLAAMAGYALASLGFAWRAVRGFRRRVLD